MELEMERGMRMLWTHNAGLGDAVLLLELKNREPKDSGSPYSEIRASSG